MDMEKTRRWVLTWWQDNGFRLSGQLGMDNVTLFATKNLEAEKPHVAIELRLDLQPDLTEFISETVKVYPTVQSDDADFSQQAGIAADIHRTLEQLQVEGAGRPRPLSLDIQPVGPGPGQAGGEQNP
jgi:hypothetical protein